MKTHQVVRDNQCTTVTQGSHPECLKPSVQSPTTLAASQASLTLHYTITKNIMNGCLAYLV